MEYTYIVLMKEHCIAWRTLFDSVRGLRPQKTTNDGALVQTTYAQVLEVVEVGKCRKIRWLGIYAGGDVHD